MDFVGEYSGFRVEYVNILSRMEKHLGGESVRVCVRKSAGPIISFYGCPVVFICNRYIVSERVNGQARCF